MKTITALASLRLTLLCAAVVFCVLPFRTAQAAQFIPLCVGTGANGVSGDGAFAIGYGPGGQAARWSTNSGESLGLGLGSARAASQSGSVVVGSTQQNNTYEAFRWTENAGMQVLTRLPGFSQANAADVSADGSIVVGTLREENVNIAEAFRWTDGGGMVGLGTLSGGPTSYSVASGVSADGLAVVGWSGSNPNAAESYLWTEAGGMQGLGVLPGDPFSSAAGISADGSTVVGASGNCCRAQPYRWTAGTGMLGLGHLPGRDVSNATGVSGDGSVVVGYSEHSGTSDGEAFIWDETHGMRRLQDVLTAEGLDLTGWRLQYAGGVSDDGNVIVGYGDNPAGRREGWIARLNTVFGDPDFNNDGQLNCSDIDALVAQIAAGTNGSLFDLTGDGLVDTADLDEWRVQAGAANLSSGNPYLEGDANLDGAVDGSDFSIWNNHKFTNVAAWCSGDFNASGSVDGSDLSIWSSNRFTSSDSVAAVPEPGTFCALLSAAICVAMLRRRRSSQTKKGVRTLLPERPCGCFAQKGPDPFFRSANIGVNAMNQQTTIRRCLDLRWRLAPLFVACCVCLSTGDLFAVVTFDWATVGNPGNAGEEGPGPVFGTYGAVSYVYRISKHEVTNAQYTEFLNAVDPIGGNALALYNTFMSTDANGGINFNAGNANGSKYEIKLGRDNNPVVYVSFIDAMRFTNWLQNGQGSGSTESGVYTIGNGVNETRNPSAAYFVPSEDEWYKAAYHKNDGVTDHYWDFPTSTDASSFSDQPPGSDAPTQSNTVNIFLDDMTANGYNDGYAVTGRPGVNWLPEPGQNYLTDVGAYTSSLSPYGTFDQGGNAYEWTEAVSCSSFRVLRGGYWGNHGAFSLTASAREVTFPTAEQFGYSGMGFRVATAGSGTADFNADGSINCADVDSLVAEIAAGANSASFDLTGDGLVNIADLDQWRVQAGAANLPSGNPYLEGDANLDGAVDGSDFSIWSTHKFTNVAAWCSGDFNASGSVDGSDFSIWSSNKFTTSATASTVPEPAAALRWLITCLALSAKRLRW